MHVGKPIAIVHIPALEAFTIQFLARATESLAQAQRGGSEAGASTEPLRRLLHGRRRRCQLRSLSLSLLLLSFAHCTVSSLCPPLLSYTAAG